MTPPAAGPDGPDGPDGPPEAIDLAAIAGFLRDLGQALHSSGAAAHDLERRLTIVGKYLGVRVEGFAVLTFLALTVAAPGGTRRVEMLRLPAYDYNMARLIDLQALCREINDVSRLDEYIARLDALTHQAPPWSGWQSVLQGFLLSASVAALLRGGWMEMGCGGLIGLLFVAGHQRLSRITGLTPAIPVILCALAALLAQGLAVLLPQQSPFISAVAGVVLLLPGFMLTVAMSELATQNFLAGTGRLAGAFMLLFLMGAGLVIGTKIGLALLPVQALGTVTALPAWMIWPAISILGVSLLSVIQAPLSAIHISAGACLLTWAVYSLVSASMGNIVGAFAGALAVASAGHVYQYLTKRPAVLVQIPGLITLVPGSMGFRGLHALMEQDSIVGIGLITDTVLTGAVLAVGLLLADNIAPWLMQQLDRKKPGKTVST
jgi:uncharacterized membrane protein YjjP (DUF1212 family)